MLLSVGFHDLEAFAQIETFLGVLSKDVVPKDLRDMGSAGIVGSRLYSSCAHLQPWTALSSRNLTFRQLGMKERRKWRLL